MARFLIIPIILLLLAPAAFGGSSSKTIWHYRMTITVETPEGLKSGSAVREVVYGGETHGGGGPTLDLKAHGEAVVVDLGKYGVLFGLLTGGDLGSDYGSDILLTAFDGGGMDPASVPKQGKVQLNPERYPEFVRFRVATDPTSVEVIHDEYAPVQKFLRGKTTATFESAFGKGVRLKEVTIEVTADPVTRGTVKKYAPTYAPMGKFMAWVTKLEFDDPRRFGPEAIY